MKSNSAGDSDCARTLINDTDTYAGRVASFLPSPSSSAGVSPPKSIVLSFR